MLLIGTSEKSTKAKGWELFFLLGTRQVNILSVGRGTAVHAVSEAVKHPWCRTSCISGDGRRLLEDGKFLKCCLKADVMYIQLWVRAICRTGVAINIFYRQRIGMQRRWGNKDGH
ncbi:hypothetical protein ARMGADRAFT_1040671 [Armillaria gallica]|uniref:Uncharacterized protein n=1 Tax=Armillaria gallica TaxID=47427 RepID=A0A2H3CK96_ARMGA|nr:hypothetical protein ARMGADRAFT_1040671 [Armillaria gallica]